MEIITAITLSVVAMVSAAPSQTTPETCHFLKYPNVMMIDTKMDYVSAPTLAECHMKCEAAKNPPCVAFMHQDSTTFCALSGEQPNSVGMVPNRGTDVYEMQCFSPEHTCHGFRCDNGYCINPELQCNAFDDCRDGTDERDCMDGYQGDAGYVPDDDDEGYYEDQPESTDGGGGWEEGVHWGIVENGYYLCHNRNKVIHWFVCDGDDDCLDLSDERFCKREQKEFMPELIGLYTEEPEKDQVPHY